MGIAGALAAPALISGVQVREIGYTTGAYQPALSPRTAGVVQIEVVVRGQQGRAIAGMKRADFQVRDNGRPARIQSFHEVTRRHPAALVGVFLDDLHLTPGDLQTARAAALELAHSGWAQGALVALDTASHSVRLAPTSDSVALSHALEKVLPHPPATPPGPPPCPRISPFQAYSALVAHHPPPELAEAAVEAACPDEPPAVLRLGAATSYQAPAVWEAAAKRSHETLASIRDFVAELATQAVPGRTAAIWIISGGFLAAPLGPEQDLVVGDALATHVVLDTLALAPPEGRGPSEEEAYRLALANLTASSGGIVVSSPEQLGAALQGAGTIPAAAYELEYAPHGLVRDGALHRLAVALASALPQVVLQARAAYYAPSPASMPQFDAELLDAAMLGHTDQSGVPVQFTTARTSSGMGVTAHVNMKHLPFAPCQDRHCQSLVLAVGVFAEDGKFELGKQERLELSFADGISDATSLQARADGGLLSVEVPISPRSRRLRVVLQRASDGALTTFDQYLEFE